MSRNKNNTSTLIRNTVIYAVFVGILSWLIFFNRITLGDLVGFLPMPEQIAAMGLDSLLLPVLISVTVFYIASLVGIFLEGTFSEVLVGTLYAAGFAAFFATFLILNPNENVKEAGILLSGAFGTVLVYNTVNAFAKIRRMPWLKAVMVSVTIYSVGQITVLLLQLLMSSAISGSPIIDAIGNFINLGVTIAAIFTFLAIFKTSENAYLGALGGIASNYVFAVALSVIGALYYGFITETFSEIAPGIESLAPYVQWTGICIFAALVFTIMRRGMQGSIIVRNRMGTWQKHLQQITTYKGDRFLGFTHIVDEFINQGKKERLLIRLILFLHENHMKDDEISKTLEELIKYEDEKKPTLSREGQLDTINKNNRENRLGVIQRTLEIMVPSSNLGLNPKLDESIVTASAQVAQSD